MATLAEALTIKIAADTRELEAAGKKAGRVMKSVSTEAKKTNDSIVKSSMAAVDSLDRVKNGFERIRGIAVLATAAVAAVTVPILKTRDSFKELMAVSKLSTGQAIPELEARSKELANSIGKTYSATFDEIKKGTVKLRGDVEAAMATTAAAKSVSEFGLIDEKEAKSSIERVLVAFGKGKDAVDEISGSILTGVTKAGMTASDFASSLDALARPATRAAVGFDRLAATVIDLGQRGGKPAEIVALIGRAIESATNPTEEQIRLLDQLGINYSQTDLSGERLATTLEALSNQAMAGNREAVEGLIGADQGLFDVLTSLTGKTDGYAKNLALVNALTIDFKRLSEEAKGPLDSLEESGAAAFNNTADAAEAAIEVVNRFTESVIKSNQALFGDKPGQFGSFMQFKNSNQGGVIEGYAGGGGVPGSGSSDSVPAMLTPGEFVVKKHVAQAVMPFLQQLNSGGISPSALHNTFLSSLSIKGTPLLELLGITRDSRMGGGLSGGNTQELLSVASGIRGAIESLSLNRGGAVPRYATGGEVQGGGGSSPITVNVTAHSMDESFVKRRLGPMIQRLSGRGQDRRGRSGR